MSLKFSFDPDRRFFSIGSFKVPTAAEDQIMVPRVTSEIQTIAIGIVLRCTLTH